MTRNTTKSQEKMSQCHVVHLKNPTWTELGANMGVLSKEPATDARDMARPSLVFWKLIFYC